MTALGKNFDKRLLFSHARYFTEEKDAFPKIATFGDPFAEEAIPVFEKIPSEAKEIVTNVT